MKVIVSHDIDHINVSEHLTDLIIPKFLARSGLELFSGNISLSEFAFRIINLCRNKWQCLDELMDFNTENNIPATFFIGVENGRGLNYSGKARRYWINKIRERNYDIGVHSIAYDNLVKVIGEYKFFKEISGIHAFGTRVHYIKRSDDTLNFLAKAGYSFDSSDYEIKDPYKVHEMWEFPLHIMDGYIIENNGKYQNITLNRARELTLERIQKAKDLDLKYLNILFHDRYFDRSFKAWKDWYIWLIAYLKEQGYEFISFNDAMAELENHK